MKVASLTASMRVQDRTRAVRAAADKFAVDVQAMVGEAMQAGSSPEQIRARLEGFGTTVLGAGWTCLFIDRAGYAQPWYSFDVRDAGVRQNAPMKPGHVEENSYVVLFRSPSEQALTPAAAVAWSIAAMEIQTEKQC